MRKRRERDDDQFDLDAESVTSGPVRFRREVRSGSTRNRVNNKRKASSSSRRKVSKPGGIHQRANKRMSW